MKNIFISVFLLVFLPSYIFIQACPSKTIVGKNYIYFVGRLDGLSGDEKVIVWFEYGLDKENLSKKTKKIELREPKIFCVKETKLKNCTTYFYRAVAENSAGINYGETKYIKTLCNKKLKK